MISNGVGIINNCKLTFIFEVDCLGSGLSLDSAQASTPGYAQENIGILGIEPWSAVCRIISPALTLNLVIVF